MSFGDLSFGDRNKIYIFAKLSQGNKFMYSWIPKKKNLKIGSIIELKPNYDLWKVNELYPETIQNEYDLKEKQSANKNFGSSLIKSKGKIL